MVPLTKTRECRGKVFGNNEYFHVSWLELLSKDLWLSELKDNQIMFWKLEILSYSRQIYKLSPGEPFATYLHFKGFHQSSCSLPPLGLVQKVKTSLPVSKREGSCSAVPIKAPSSIISEFLKYICQLLLMVIPESTFKLQ